MRIFLSAVLAIAFVCLARESFAQNVEGQIIASQFGQYIVPATTTGSFQFPPATCQVSGGGKNFAAFATGVPVKIVDSNPSLIEIATPSSVYINSCVINMATTHTHVPPFYLTSGTGGLQEAITNGPVKGGGANTVILNADWYAQVAPGNPATVIATVKGNNTIGLVDITKTPYVWYQWNGTQYAEISFGGDVSSVFGRTGAVVVVNGDYNCAQVTNCGSAPNAGWAQQVASNQGTTDNTLVMNSVGGVPATGGMFFVDAEYESFTGISGNTLTGVTRGLNGTTPSTHGAGVGVVSINVLLSNIPSAGVFGNAPTFSIGNGFPGTGYPFQLNSGTNEFDVLPDSTIVQHNTSATSYLSPFEVGVPNGHFDGTNGLITVTNTNYLVQDNAAHELGQPIGDSGGFAGVLAAIPAPSVGAPSLIPQFIGPGTCNITYVVTGVDADGIEVPGTATTINNLAPWTAPGQVAIRYPSAAGVVSYNAYRTAVSGGCTGLATGKFASGITGNAGAISDVYTGGDSTSPPGSNSSVAKSCVGSAGNHELYCALSGSSSTPPLACNSSTYGWNYTNVAATASPSSYHCYSGASTWTAVGSGGSPIPGVQGEPYAAPSTGSSVVPASSALYLDASQFSGADPSVKINACGAALLAAGGGTCDARALGGTSLQAMSQTIAWGSHALISANESMVLLLPNTAQWEWALTGGTACGIEQFSNTSIIGQNTGGMWAGMQLVASSSANMDSLYCTDPSPVSAFGSNIYASGFFATNANGGTFANGLVDFRELADDANFYRITAINPSGDAMHINDVCCGDSWDSVQGLSATSTEATGTGHALEITGKYTNIVIRNSTFNGPGTGKYNVYINPTANSNGLTFLGLYAEKYSTGDYGTPMVYVGPDAINTNIFGGLLTNGCGSSCAQYAVQNASLQGLNIEGLGYGYFSLNGVNDTANGFTQQTDGNQINNYHTRYTTGSAGPTNIYQDMSVGKLSGNLLNGAPTFSATSGTATLNSGSNNTFGSIASTVSGTLAFNLTMTGGPQLHRLVCTYTDETTPTDIIHETGSTGQYQSFASGTTVTGDTIVYVCGGY